MKKHYVQELVSIVRLATNIPLYVAGTIVSFHQSFYNCEVPYLSKDVAICIFQSKTFLHLELIQVYINCLKIDTCNIGQDLHPLFFRQLNIHLKAVPLYLIFIYKLMNNGEEQTR